jgi:hypothetical protein
MSTFADLMTGVAVPALQDVFGDDMTHTNSEGDEATVVGMLETNYGPVGEFGERMEPRTTITVAKSDGVAVGDTLHYAGTVTDDDPYPDDVVWTMTQIIEDDGYLVRFAARQQ